LNADFRQTVHPQTGPVGQSLGCQALQSKSSGRMANLTLKQGKFGSE
jgi:hypothetical protein